MAIELLISMVFKHNFVTYTSLINIQALVPNVNMFTPYISIDLCSLRVKFDMKSATIVRMPPILQTEEQNLNNTSFTEPKFNVILCNKSV